jgi:hypothetical protein
MFASEYLYLVNSDVNDENDKDDVVIAVIDSIEYMNDDDDDGYSLRKQKEKEKRKRMRIENDNIDIIDRMLMLMYCDIIMIEYE